MSTFPILNIKEFQFDKNGDSFYANIFSDHLEEHHKAITRPHKHDFYLVVLFTKGHGTHEIDFNAFPIEPGSLFLLKPGQTHNWELSEDIEGYIFFHNKEYYNLAFTSKRIDQLPFYYSSQNTPLVKLKGAQLNKFKELFSEIQQEYEHDELLKSIRLHCLVDLLYIDLSRTYLRAGYAEMMKTSNYSQKLQKLEQLIEQNYLTEKQPKQYAEWMFMSTKHLNRIVNDLLGKTTSSLILERVTLEAKRLLIQSDNTVDQVAKALGYDDSSYFTRLFKKKCGETPKAFQKRYA